MKRILFSMFFLSAAIGIFFYTGCGKKTPPVKSAFLLIEDTVKENKLDEDTALLYKLYALFGHEDLPEKYHSALSTRGGDALLREIRRKWDGLSPDVQKKIEPFFKNPLDPESALFVGKDKNLSGIFDFTKTAYANVPDITGLNHFVTNNGKVKIWYKDSQLAVASLVLNAFNNDNIYEKETGLMAHTPLSDNSQIGDDDKFDIFFKNISDEGLCYLGPVVNRKCYGWIILNQSLAGDKMKDALSHEFFHAVQYAVDCLEDDWWQEATATWAQHFVYKSIDTEHEWLSEYFEEFKMAKSITTKNDKHEYAAYVFPLYIAQKFGDSMVGKIWQACEGAAVNAEAAVESKLPGGWKDAFKEFSLWLYNQEPERYFRDRPGVFLPATPDIYDIMLSTEDTPDMDIEPLAALIANYIVDDSSIRSVDFDMERFHSIYPNVALWAMIKPKNQEMRLEDWSGISFRNFCFDLPEEDLEQLILVYGNGSRTQKKEKLFDVEYYIYKHGCEAKLDLNWSVSHMGGGSAQFGKHVPGFATAQGTYGENGNLSASFRVEASNTGNDDRDRKLIPYGAFTFSAMHTSGGRAGVTGVYSMGGAGKTSASGSDSWDGNERSKKGYGLLRLEIIKHKPQQESGTISQSDMDMVSGPMRDMLLQMQSMQQSLPAGFAPPRDPDEGEIKYKLFLRIDNIPGSFYGKADIQSSRGSGSTNFGEPTDMGMLIPIDIEDIVPAENNVISINKSFAEGSARIRVSGTLKIKRQ